MIKKIFLPDPCLNAFVSHYMNLEINIGEAEKGIICSFPYGACIMCIIYSECLPEFLFRNGKKFQIRSFLSGLITTDIKIGNRGKFGCILVYFTPLGAYQLFKVPQCEYFNKFIPPAFIIKGFEQVIEKIYLEHSDIQRINILNNFLKESLCNSVGKSNHYGQISSYINQMKGRIQMTDIVQKFNITPRTLDRNFSHLIGLPPKPYANLVRLCIAYQMIMFRSFLTIQDIIFLLGYYDQSHVYREFAKYSDISPAELKSNSFKVLLTKILMPEMS